MTFKRADPNENFFHRWISAGGRWELGLTQMMFGVRVRLGLVGSMCVELDYCAGADVNFQEELLRAVMIILIPIDENVSVRELCNKFPSYETKPIYNDPCWGLLQQMADAVLSLQQDKSA